MWAATGRAAHSDTPNVDAMATAARMNMSSHVSAAHDGGAQGFVAIVLRGSTHSNGFIDLLTACAHLGEVSAYLTCEQAVEMAGKLLAAVNEAQERLAKNKES